MTRNIVGETPGAHVVLGHLGVGEQLHGVGHQLHVALGKPLYLEVHIADLHIYTVAGENLLT